MLRLKNFWDKTQKHFSLSTAFGLILYLLIFYNGWFVLPQNLGTIVIFGLIFLGTAGLLYDTRRFPSVLACCLVVFLFCLPLVWIWRGLIVDDSIFLGRFVFNDAYFYLTDANRLLYGENFSYFSTRRPLFAGLMAFLLKITNNNLQVSLGLLAVNVGFSTYLLAREIRQNAGSWVAAFTLCLTFYTYEGHGFVGRVLTENLGLSLGVLGLALLLKGVKHKDLWKFVLGAFVLSLALNARAGAFFALPALFLWGVFSLTFKESRWIKAATIGGGIALAFSFNLLLVKCIGSSDGQVFSNFGNTLYGLAAGYKGWSYAGRQNLGGVNMYQAALNLILANPVNLLYGIARSFMDYLHPETMFQYMYFENQQEIIISYFLYGVTILGLVRLWWLRKNAECSFLLALFAGCFLSVSFVPPIDEGIRALTATIPVNALAAGFLFYRPQLIQTGVSNILSRRKSILVYYVLLSVVISIFGPLYVKYTPLPFLNVPVKECSAGTEQVTLKINPGYYTNIIEFGPKYSFLPFIRQKDILGMFKQFNNVGYPSLFIDFRSLSDAIRNLSPGQTLIMGFELKELSLPSGLVKPTYLIMPTAQIEKYDGVISVCAKLADAPRLAGNRFYYEESILVHP